MVRNTYCNNLYEYFMNILFYMVLFNSKIKLNHESLFQFNNAFQIFILDIQKICSKAINSNTWHPNLKNLS